MYQTQLEILRLLLETTRKGKAAWQRENASVHRAEVAGLRFSFRFKCPLIAGDSGSESDVVEVTANGSVWTYFNGTEGFALVAEILTASHPAVREHNQRVAAQLGEAIDRLRKQL